MRSEYVHARIDLDRVRENAERIRSLTGKSLIAVIKADAYGLGAPRVADAIASVADELAYFTPAEARRVGRPGLVMGPPLAPPEEFRELRLRPMIACVEDAERFRGFDVAINFDTGMQRFGCDVAMLARLRKLCRYVDICTHTASVEGANRLREVAGDAGAPLHAASSSLLNEPRAWLNAVRPGVALYRGAVRVTTRLVAARETRGPIGYTGFTAPRVGVILAGYSHGLRPAPIKINGRRQQLLEIGMNTSFVSVDPSDRVGDEVVLLGNGITEAELAAALGVREHEVLCRYCGMSRRRYGLRRSRIKPVSADTSPAPVSVPHQT
ncbi:MAG: alanine racemase [Phycisphaerales bacterium]|nr:alanine racemase [Phycisphaerales bacterium]